MPVLRQSEGVRLAAGDNRQYAQPQLEAAPVRVNSVTNVGDSSWQGKLIESLSGTALRVATIAGEAAQRDSYLAGQAKAGQIKSEEEIEGNPLTRAWEVAGYRDVMGKLQIADTDAQIAVDMASLREESPAKMQEYLTARRGAVMPNLESMSRDQRENVFSQLLLSDRAATSKHGAEHRAFILDQKVRPIREQMMVDLDTLQEVRNKAAVDPANYKGAYTEQLGKTVGGIVTNIWNDSSIPLDTKQRFTSEALQHSMLTGGVDVYGYFKDTNITVRGKPTRVLSMLSDTDTVKLAGQFKKALADTAVDRNMNGLTMKADVESQIGKGTYEGTQKELQGLLTQWRVDGIIRTQSDYDGMMLKYANMRAEVANDSRASIAYAHGDTGALANLNVTEAQGLAALEKSYARNKVPLSQRATELLALGAKHGMSTAYAAVGKYLGPAMMQLGNPDSPINQEGANQDNGRLFSVVMDGISKATREGDTAAYANMIGGMTDAQQNRVLSIRAMMRDVPFDEAVRRTVAQEAELATLSPNMRAARAVSSEDITKALSTYSEQGSIMKGLRGMWGSVKGQLAPDEASWTDNPDLVSRQVARMRTQILAEASTLSYTNVGLDAESLVTKAAANLTQRTIGTSQGPVTLPYGTKVHAYFGVPTSVEPERISAALSTMLVPSQKGNRMEFEATPQGVRFREVTPDGQHTNHTGILDAKSVSVKVRESMDAEAALHNRVYGAGSTRTKNNQTVAWNGENSVAMAEPLMYKFRSNLIANENFREGVYDDKTGKPVPAGKKPIGTLTAGVGLTGDYMPKPGPDGKIARADLDKAFVRATDDAAANGLRIAELSGLHNDSATLLFSELSYQSGTGFFEKFNSYQKTVQVMQSGTAEEAVKEFRKTPAYFASGADRRLHYIKLIEQSMKGK